VVGGSIPSLPTSFFSELDIRPLHSGSLVCLTREHSRAFRRTRVPNSCSCLRAFEMYGGLSDSQASESAPRRSSTTRVGRRERLKHEVI